VRRLHDFIVRLNPEPHRRTFLKAVHARGHRGVLFFVPQGSSGRAGESLPWIRGFNEYDNWQASGVSGRARGRFTIRVAMNCADCHMPQVPSSG